MSTHHLESTERSDLSNVTVLVIDHDVPSTELLEACLQPFGARVVPARSAAEARTIIEAMIPDVVICDLTLPDENGIEFIRWLRGQGPDRGGVMPAIAVTFFYERFDVRETRAAGYDMFVRKPIDPLEIVYAVTILLRRRRPSPET